MKSKEYIYNYVDRVRFAEGSSFPDHKCPSRGSGWRQNKSISHLDLATSCHSAASGLNHWSSHQSRHQLRHSRSLDYNHIDRCKDALDIAEYYWRLDHGEPEVYDEEEEAIIEPEHSGGGSQLKYVSEHHLTQHYRDFKCADDNYHHSANSIYQSPQQLQQQQQQQSPQQQQQQQQNSRQQLSSSSASIPHQPASGAIPPQAFEFASDSCSLRRSRSLAVIREETFSDLQISSSNDSRRSQLIPRARLVHRGYFRERDRLICNNNKHHHHHHSSREKLTNCSSSSGGAPGNGSNAPSIDADEQSNESVAETCDSHQQQLQLQNYKQQQQQKQQPKSHHQQHLHYHPLYHEAQQTIATSTAAAAAANDYYDHLKRLDKLALGLVQEQLHPWHNDKSDLESLNSDYFKNSLHQSHELKQQHYEIEALEQAVNLLAHDNKPRIYQSRRQKRSSLEKSQKLSHSAGASGGESCPETSQSSVFPETTTSNSEGQSDSGSLSEQEYDITKIEEIYQKTHIEGDEESYEIISLTTTTRTRFETTEDEEGEEYTSNDQHLDEEDYTKYDTEESNQHTTTDTEVEGTLKRSRAVSDNLQKIIAYDSVYLSSEESSDSTLVDIEQCDNSLEVSTSLGACIDQVETLLHISIEDAIYEPKAKQHKIDIDEDSVEDLEIPQPISFVETVNTKIEILQEESAEELEIEEVTPIYTQILKVEHTPAITTTTTSSTAITTTIPVGVTSSAASKPKILSVVEKRKLKRYSDSAYSSNVSDSSDKTGHGSYPSTESYAFSSHLKRQVAEPLYIPLKSNLSDNQYHSLPDVNIGQSLKLCESIDVQLRSSYNLDNYRSLDDTSVGDQLEDKDGDADAGADSPNTSNQEVENNHVNNSSHKKLLDVVTSEQIYDSIKRFGRAHQKYRQREFKESHHQQQLEQDEQEKLTEKEQENNSSQVIRCNEISAEINEDSPFEDFIEPALEDTTPIKTDYLSQSPDSVEDYPNPVAVEQPRTTADFDLPNTDVTHCLRSPEQFDSYEKSKEAPVISVENFSQLIERRAKEIRQSGRRTKLQQIEFANRAKFRLENTLTNYSETHEAPVYQSSSTASTTKPSSTFRIVVTDAQNNVIEEDSIESQKSDRQVEEKENHNLINLPEETKDVEDLFVIKVNKNRVRDKSSPSNHAGNSKHSSLKRAPSKPKRQQYPLNLANQHLSSAEVKKLTPNSPKTKERRVLSNQIYRARPVKVITATDSFRRNKVKQTSSKMSRPQILQVIDNKRKSNTCGSGTNNTLLDACTAATTTAGLTSNANKIESSQVEKEYLQKVDAVRCYWSKLANDEENDEQQQHTEEAQQLQQQQAEVISSEPSPPPIEVKELVSKPSFDVETPRPAQQHPEKRHFILGAVETPKTSKAPAPVHVNDSKAMPPTNPDDYCSFMPSIEIVELDGDKKATIVSAVPSNADATDETLDATEPQFDHIRYKVLKSQQLLRSNILARNKKEAQFDGLIQYLQEYSFQELLSNNNVVIVEPVRTKIERPSSTPCTHATHFQERPQILKSIRECRAPVSALRGDESVARKLRTVSNSSGNNTTGGLSSGIKRHFFYQPVRVNRELYEEELPNPDTVRNVRKFFEENILPTPGQGLLTTTTTMTTTTTTCPATTTVTKSKNKNNGNGSNLANKQTSPKSRRTRKYRYLTIDTSYGHAGTAATTATTKLQQQHQQQQQLSKPRNSQHSRKWDTASLSSGVSSGDLSSPCECNETDPVNQRTDKQTTESRSNDEHTTPGVGAEGRHELPPGIHVQDIVNKHNNVDIKKTRAGGGGGAGIPVRSSSIRPRNTIYGYSALHKSGQTNIYRNVYEYHAIRGQMRPDSDGDQEADGDADDDDDDDDDLFGDVDDDDNELCDTYYVSNDVLRKIRECGSSVTYYGGRVVQTTAANPASKSFEAHCGNNGLNATTKHGMNATPLLMAHNQPTMLSQTQTRARVREIETCCNAAACHPANECHHNNAQHGQKKQLQQQKKIHLNECEDNEPNKALSGATKVLQQRPMAETMAQGHQNNSSMEGGVTFKLVKSNSCSSRLELAGTDVDIVVQSEPEETEVVRKMVHHFEATTNNRATLQPDVSLTINNKTPLQRPDAAATEKLLRDSCVKQVTVNNHINVVDDQQTVPADDLARRANGIEADEQRKQEDQKTYQTEAKDIHLDTQGRGSVGAASAAAMKVCRNRNVDLAFTLVKQPQQHQTKSLGNKDPEIANNNNKNHKNIVGLKTHTHNSLAQQQQQQDTNCVTYDNTLLPTITASASVVSDYFPKVSTGNLRIDEKTPTNGKREATMTLSPLPAQIIVPVEIHRTDNPIIPKVRHHPSSATATTTSPTTTPKGAADEKCFLPLSTASSVTSVVDKSVVRHYVANDRSIYEKRKYDDIEFEEFEVYDPTKDFEKLIEEEEAKRAATLQLDDSNETTLHEDIAMAAGQQSATSTTSSTGTTKSQQTNSSTETETDCYDSLDDKL